MIFRDTDGSAAAAAPWLRMRMSRCSACCSPLLLCRVVSPPTLPCLPSYRTEDNENLWRQTQKQRNRHTVTLHIYEKIQIILPTPNQYIHLQYLTWYIWYLYLHLLNFIINLNELHFTFLRNTQRRYVTLLKLIYANWYIYNLPPNTQKLWIFWQLFHGSGFKELTKPKIIKKIS